MNSIELMLLVDRGFLMALFLMLKSHQFLGDSGIILLTLLPIPKGTGSHHLERLLVRIAILTNSLSR